MSSFLKGSLAGYSFPGWHRSVQNVASLYHSFLVCDVSVEKSVDYLIGALLYLMIHFSFAVSRFSL